MQVIAKVLKKGLPPQPACGAINADNTAERIAKLLEVIDYLRLDLERKNKIIDDYLNRKGR